MEEIHSKTDEESAVKKPSTETNNTVDIEKSSSTGGNSDMQQIREGGEGNKSELGEKLGDGSIGLWSCWTGNFYKERMTYFRFYLWQTSDSARTKDSSSKDNSPSE